VKGTVVAELLLAVTSVGGAIRNAAHAIGRARSWVCVLVSTLDLHAYYQP